MVVFVSWRTDPYSATSYLEVDEADKIFEAFGESRWDSLADDSKQILLNAGTASLDGAARYVGKKVYENQMLEFPRSVNGTPEKVKLATCKMIHHSVLAGGGFSGIKRERTGNLEIEYFQKYFSSSLDSRPDVKEILGDLVAITIPIENGF